MDRVAYVSGGASGIGRVIARSLFGDGYRVVIFGRRAERLRAVAAEIAAGEIAAGADSAGAGRVHAVAADLADPVAVEVGLARARELAGDAVDAVVNAAGGTSALPTGSLAEVAAEWQDEWRINVLTAVLPTTAALPYLRRPGARVVSISSIAALRGGGSYGAAKAALHAWTYSLAQQLGADGTANVVAPGYVEDTEFFGDRMTPQRREALVGQTLTGRAGRPEDVADTVRWLVSPAAGHITGQVLQVNGGALFGHG